MSYVSRPLDRVRRAICMATWKWISMRYWSYLCLHVKLGIKESMIRLNEDDTSYASCSIKTFGQRDKCYVVDVVAIRLQSYH